MQSLRELFRIGHGPSSSHTMGPAFAAEKMREYYPSADLFRVVLQGSLAKTGRGHRTDYALTKSLAPCSVEIAFDTETEKLPHPNTLIIEAYEKGNLLAHTTWMSVGGGAVREQGGEPRVSREYYKLSNLTDIADYCDRTGIKLSDYVLECEDADFPDFLHEVWKQMQETIRQGLSVEGYLPGGLHVHRKAKMLYEAAGCSTETAEREQYLLSAYAYASAEENAAGEMMVTAPTCGACGVLPAVLFYELEEKKVPESEILEALATAGLIGNLIKTNGSISGAECGCQAEIGSACSMAAAALAQIRGLSLRQIDCAAEIAMEHNLGLTCDPVNGLVQIPCIERNAMAALRAHEAAALAGVIFRGQKVRFDVVVQTMKETGQDLSSYYRETAQGGLAKHYVKDFD